MEQEFNKLQREVIQNLYNFFGDEMDTYYIQGEIEPDVDYPERYSYGVGNFFVKDGKEDQTFLGEKKYYADDVLDRQIEIIQKIEKLFTKNKEEVPMRLRWVFDTDSHRLRGELKYQNDFSPEEIDDFSWKSLDDWVNEVL